MFVVEALFQTGHHRGLFGDNFGVGPGIVLSIWR